MSKSTTYLIHAEEKLAGHAQHYIGSTDCLESRIAIHRQTQWKRFPAPVQLGNGRRKNGGVVGAGATILGAFNAAGIAWSVVRTWKGGRKVERKLKRWKKSKQLCPACNPNAERLARKVQV